MRVGGSLKARFRDVRRPIPWEDLLGKELWCCQRGWVSTKQELEGVGVVCLCFSVEGEGGNEAFEGHIAEAVEQAKPRVLDNLAMDSPKHIVKVISVRCAPETRIQADIPGHCPALSLPWDSGRHRMLRKRYAVVALPRLVVLHSDGSLMIADAGQALEKEGTAAVQVWIQFARHSSMSISSLSHSVFRRCSSGVSLTSVDDPMQQFSPWESAAWPSGAEKLSETSSSQPEVQQTLFPDDEVNAFCQGGLRWRPLSSSIRMAHLRRSAKLEDYDSITLGHRSSGRIIRLSLNLPRPPRTPTNEGYIPFQVEPGFVFPKRSPVPLARCGRLQAHASSKAPVPNTRFSAPRIP